MISIQKAKRQPGGSGYEFGWCYADVRRHNMSFKTCSAPSFLCCQISKPHLYLTTTIMQHLNHSSLPRTQYVLYDGNSWQTMTKPPSREYKKKEEHHDMSLKTHAESPVHQLKLHHLTSATKDVGGHVRTSGRVCELVCRQNRVAPQAMLKLFLTNSKEERWLRRWWALLKLNDEDRK